MTPPQTAHSFAALRPVDCAPFLRERGLPVLEGLSLQTLENQVFRVGEVVVKVYRPGRWSRRGILDELEFLKELRAEGLAVPCQLGAPGDLAGFNCVAFRAVPGPYVEDLRVATSAQIDGLVELIAAVHEVGARRPAPHRPRFAPFHMVECILRALGESGRMPPAFVPAYEDQAWRIARSLASRSEGLPQQRIHGDPGPNNVLWRDEGPFLLDFDDMYMGPVAGDLFLMGHSSLRHQDVPGELDRRDRWALQTAGLLTRYRALRSLSSQQESLFGLLFSLRSLVFDAWHCARWDEPAFHAAYAEDDPADPEWWREGFDRRELNLREAEC